MPEHADVATIEKLLGEPSEFATLLALPRPLQSALWICACVALDDAPAWLIVGTTDGAAWCRVPDKVEPIEMLQPDEWCGGHAEPEGVLLWLQGEAATPWEGAGDGWGNIDVLASLRQRLANRGP